MANSSSEQQQAPQAEVDHPFLYSSHHGSCISAPTHPSHDKTGVDARGCDSWRWNGNRIVEVQTGMCLTCHHDVAKVEYCNEASFTLFRVLDQEWYVDGERLVCYNPSMFSDKGSDKCLTQLDQIRMKDCVEDYARQRWHGGFVKNGPREPPTGRATHNTMIAILMISCCILICMFCGLVFYLRRKKRQKVNTKEAKLEAVVDSPLHGNMPAAPVAATVPPPSPVAIGSPISAFSNEVSGVADGTPQLCAACGYELPVGVRICPKCERNIADALPMQDPASPISASSTASPLVVMGRAVETE